jgi:hypothetical protein
MAGKSVTRLIKSTEAWNVDGSSDACPTSRSWIADAENATGRTRGRCSYEGCDAPATVGGHVWVKGSGCFIAPICSKCNYHRNTKRMQGAGSRLRANIDVTRTKQTIGMKTATRRIVLKRRRCSSCNVDISKRPKTHKVCLNCFRSGTRDRKRKCDICNVDMSNRPKSHKVCLDCFRSGTYSQHSRALDKWSDDDY